LLMNHNDEVAIGEGERERLIRKAFAEHDVEVEFIN
jgi:hypothetical protein